MTRSSTNAPLLAAYEAEQTQSLDSLRTDAGLSYREIAARTGLSLGRIQRRSSDRAFLLSIQQIAVPFLA
jgi:DNA-directed RNA polymerase specialized sigma24 family protein